MFFTTITNTQQRKPYKRKQPVEHQHFIAELIARSLGYGSIDGKTDERRGDGHIRHELVAWTHLREQSEYEQAQQRSVSIRSYHVNRIDDAIVIRRLEQQDKSDEQHGNEKMAPFAILLAILDICAFNT